MAKSAGKVPEGDGLDCLNTIKTVCSSIILSTSALATLISVYK
jgi:hypothetical protein